jgi:ribosomal protein S18 acetylase RimI-like enzyme
MQIKEAEIQDITEILKLQYVCYQENAKRINDYKIQPLTQTMDEIIKEFSKQLFLKAEIDSVIVGSIRASVEKNTCYIGKLIVHPDNQNRGIGSKLMTEIENRFNTVLKYELFTGSNDEKNIYLYNKLGYKIFEERRVNDNLTLVYMEKYRE